MLALLGLFGALPLPLEREALIMEFNFFEKNEERFIDDFNSHSSRPRRTMEEVFFLTLSQRHKNIIPRVEPEGAQGRAEKN